VRWDWLSALEETGCAVEAAGWVPSHVVLRRGARIVGACPAYLKLHSQGEFVFDHDWAGFAATLGIRYYPKLLVGVPFTPVSGRRFLTAPGEDRPALVATMGRLLKRLCEESRLSSVHVTFCAPDEQEALGREGYLRRIDLQFHWRNRGYADFDAYLGDLRADRRNKIRRERKETARQAITIRALEGDAITPAAVGTLFDLYKRHVDQHPWGRQYLTGAFFEEIGLRMRPSLLPIVAQREGRIVAGTFNLRDARALYGRYWGAFEEHRFLHFNVCYHAAIEACIARGIGRFEAGAGGDFKQTRGLDPEVTASLHHVPDPRFREALAEFLGRERRAVERYRAKLLRERSQLRSVRRRDT
jgi:predicted N-acyltransferase